MSKGYWTADKIEASTLYPASHPLFVTGHWTEPDPRFRPNEFHWFLPVHCAYDPQFDLSRCFITSEALKLMGL